MAFLKDLLVMGPARFIEDIYGTIEFANKLKTGFKINGSDLIYGNEGANNITTPTWGNPVNITIASSDGTNSATAATNINGSAGFTLRLPATIKATLNGNASSATKLSTNTTLKIGNTSKSFDGSETSAIEWTHAQIGASVSNTFTPSATAVGLITTVNGVAATSASIGGATATQAGLVTTGEQSFAGVKKFTNGHIYLAGAQASSSTSNTTQIVFGTPDNEHVAISSNTDAIVINKDTGTSNPQIVLYIESKSKFPSGIDAGAGGITTNGTVSGSGVINNTARGPLGWNSAGSSHADNLRLVNVNTLAYWNGSYNGSASNLTMLGTITTGTWNGTTIAVGYGGTGTTTAPTQGGIIYGASTSAYGCTAVGTSGYVLKSNGTSAPTWLAQSSIAAGSATKDGSGNTITSTYAKLKSPNDMIHNSNEICWVPDSYNDYIWINYRSVGGTGKSTVTGYKFGNANGKTENVFVEANTFSLLQSANMTYNSTDKCIEFTFA